ncbi:MAG: hypothetical protein LBG60_14430 [Bifidobacteriaceae bacterium]|nr:hypothetical protein [Bifidobacteriaceae bacterium]
MYALTQRLVGARNRVFHCEPVVFGFPLPGQLTATGKQRRVTPRQALSDFRLLITMMSPDVAAWLATWDRIDSLLADPLVGLALDYMASRSRIDLEGER